MAHNRKQKFVFELQEHVTTLARLVDSFRALEKQWFSETYGAGGADALTQADVDAVQQGLVLADVTAAVTLAQQVVRLNDNEAVTQADYGSTVAKFRSGVG